MPKVKQLTRTERRAILLTNAIPDGPDKIDFEEQRVTQDRSNMIPRRREDKQLFKTLTENQKNAYALIDAGRHYDCHTLPVPRMRFTDARGGSDRVLSKKQEVIRNNYRTWRKRLHTSSPHSLYAVIAYLDGERIRKIETDLRVPRTQGSHFIAHGLTEYCILMEWTETPKSRPRIFAYRTALSQFIADYINGTGMPVRDFKNPIDTA